MEIGLEFMPKYWNHWNVDLPFQRSRRFGSSATLQDLLGTEESIHMWVPRYPIPLVLDPGPKTNQFNIESIYFEGPDFFCNPKGCSKQYNLV